ncbi:hypothetical protein FQN50_004604 [Emmonsiellopsis sp. PD_5]|nr:hypothetical protein FQN50_004604 [Emmonsiellopsis sp. PD_5]
MPSPARLLRPLEAAPSRLSSALYVCQTCRRQCLTTTTITTRQPLLRPLNHHRRPYSSSSNDDNSKLPLTERLRRKVWGTDNPPGVKDVYGSESQLAPQPVSEVDKQLMSMQEELEAHAGIQEGDYTPATTWDGLKSVGTVEWWEEPKRVEDGYVSFLATPKATTRDQFTFFLHQAMVEMLIAKQVGSPLASICEIIPDQAHLSLINEVEITPSADFSSATLQFPDEEIEKDILELYSSYSAEQPLEELAADEDELARIESVVDAKAAEASETLNTAPAMELSPPKSLNFLSISIKDPELKFAYLKRTAQLTGHRIPDNELATISKASHLLPIFAEVSKTKKKKVADELVADGRLASLPNVRIMDRRYTPIDKEMEVGRWKVIEEELERRGLPVTGKVKME